MKNFCAISIFVIFSYVSAGQITVTPALPTDLDAATIVFDATLGNQGLMNFTGDVYAHTGVITNLSTSASDWKYVIAGWTQNTTKAKLSYLGNNKFQIVLSPSIREFYGVPSAETIKKIAFVFRNSDGSKTGRTSSGGDIFYDVYEQGLKVGFTNPVQASPVYELNAVIPVSASANGATSLTLYIDGNQVSTTTNSTISYSYTANQYGKHWMKAVATSATETKKDSVYILVRPGVTIEDLPQGMTPGVNIIDDQTVTVVLHDPPALKTYCYLIGDFSNWLIDEQFYMKRTPDGKYFWITLPNLDKSKEYIYQFLVDGTLRLADPYCTKTSDPWNDQNISSTNYPGLIPYPKDKTSGMASVFKIDESEYTWTTTNYTAPDKKNLVIYELLVRDFIAGDYIKKVKDSLDYLQKLGVNAIELMPINEFEGNDSWGYNPSFYFATDKAYGTKNDYKAFIDDCHSRGIAVIVDVVFNHSYGLSPMVQMYFSNNAPSANNPWYNQTSPNTVFSWGYDFNHQSQYTRAFIDSVLSYWLTEFKVDGFRFDFTKGFTNTVGDGSAYDASRIAVLKHYADHIWSINNDAYVILEHFCANLEEIELSNYGMLIWGNLNYNYNEATMGWLTNSDFSGVSYKNRGWYQPHLVGYMESHDEERLMFKNKTYGNSGNTNYDIKNINNGLQRNELAALFFLTVPGPKMIWQFGELGYDISIDFNGRVGRKPIHWEYYEDYNRRKLFNTYAQLIRLKKDYQVFQTSDYTLSFSGAKKWIKLNGTDMKAVVMGNFNIQNESFSIEFPNSGKWYEYFNQDSINLSNTTYNASFQPGEYRLYTSKRIKAENVYVGVSNNNLEKHFDIDIWPNPSNGNFELAINNSLANNSASITINSIIGQVVFEHHDIKLTKGVNTLSLNLDSSTPPGLYIVNLINGQNRVSKKIILH